MVAVIVVVGNAEAVGVVAAVSVGTGVVGVAAVWCGKAACGFFH